MNPHFAPPACKQLGEPTFAANSLQALLDLERLRAEGVFWENAVRLIAERERETKGWWLGQLGIAHSQSHRGQATVIRLLQGVRRH
jgi:hypothetical protein